MQQIEKDKDTAELTLTYKDGKWRMAKGMEHAKGKDEYPVLVVKENHEGKFTFKISNQDNVTFADVPFGPIPGATNPADFAGQFTITKENPKKLVVDVLNATPGDPKAEYAGGSYVYELRFNNADELDPIITNGGCCKTLTNSGGNMSMMSDPVAIGVMLGVVALIVVVIARWRRA